MDLDPANWAAVVLLKKTLEHGLFVRSKGIIRNKSFVEIVR
jgi:hypothetical protein